MKTEIKYLRSLRSTLQCRDADICKVLKGIDKRVKKLEIRNEEDIKFTRDCYIFHAERYNAYLDKYER